MSSAAHPALPRRTMSLRLWIPAILAVQAVLGSMVLWWVFAKQRQKEETRAFEELARMNAGFVERTRLPLTPKMAESLSEIIGADVFFWLPDRGMVIGSSQAGDLVDGLASRIDGRCHVLADGRMMVGSDGPKGSKIVFLRERSAMEYWMIHQSGWLTLGFYWFFSLALGYGLSKWVVQPLRRMVDVLPLVGTDDALVGLPTKRGDEIGTLAIALDRTQRSLREERDLRRMAERHAILGKMTASLAHEVRNPIAAIRLHAQLLDPEAVPDFVTSRDLIVSEAGRLEDLVAQWMSYAKPAPPCLVPVELCAALEASIALITPQASHAGVSIEFCRPENGSSWVQADRSRLQQVFVNLLRNAVQAMPAGGVVSVNLEETGSHVGISVSDQGAGFSPNALAHLGEAFFSEKEGGMGLGLAVVKDICEAHGGSMQAINLESGGACIRVAFPKPLGMNA